MWLKGCEDVFGYSGLGHISSAGEFGFFAADGSSATVWRLAVKQQSCAGGFGHLAVWTNLAIKLRERIWL